MLARCLHGVMVRTVKACDFGPLGIGATWPTSFATGDDQPQFRGQAGGRGRAQSNGLVAIWLDLPHAGLGDEANQGGVGPAPDGSPGCVGPGNEGRGQRCMPRSGALRLSATRIEQRGVCRKHDYRIVKFTMDT